MTPPNSVKVQYGYDDGKDGRNSEPRRILESLVCSIEGDEEPQKKLNNFSCEIYPSP